MSRTLGGWLCIRNGLSLDYSFIEAIQSMLPICEQVVVSDCESSDGTREFLDGWATRDPKLKIVDYPWTDPKSDHLWWPKWLNSAREHLETEWACYLDADEAFHQDSYDLIRQAVEDGSVLMCHRYNFWRDAWSVIPHGHCCGWEVIRVGPQRLWFPTDYPDPNSVEIESLAKRVPVVIGHYGYLRKRDSMFKKAREVMRIWFNDYDYRMAAVEQVDPAKNWMEEIKDTPWIHQLVPFTGSHPRFIHNWLKERGHNPIRK